MPIKPGRNVAAGQGRSRVGSEFKWDFAIAVAPGHHVTVFTSRSLGVCAAILVLVALVWLLSR